MPKFAASEDEVATGHDGAASGVGDDRREVGPDVAVEE